MAKKVTDRDPVKGAYLAMRIAPKMKFTLELLARQQHRSATGVVEWMIARAADEAFGRDSEEEYPDGMRLPSRRSLVDFVWDEDEVIRLVGLAQHLPTLMSHEEESWWRVIQTQPDLWRSISQRMKMRNPFKPDEPTLQEQLAMHAPRYIKVKTDAAGRMADGGDEEILETWLDLWLLQRAWPHIQEAAKHTLTAPQLTRIVSELKSELEREPA